MEVRVEERGFSVVYDGLDTKSFAEALSLIYQALREADAAEPEFFVTEVGCQCACDPLRMILGAKYK